MRLKSRRSRRQLVAAQSTTDLSRHPSGGFIDALPYRPSWQTRRLDPALRVSVKLGARAMARIAPIRPDALSLGRRALDVAAIPLQRVPAFVDITPAVCDGISGEWVRAGKDLDETKVILHFHGSGYFCASAAIVRPLTWRLSRAARRPVLSIDYCLAPENDLPAARAQALAAYGWLLAQGFGPQDIVIAGDSAGGHLTLVTLLALRDQGLPLPRAGVCISPWTDLTGRCASRRTNRRTDALAPPRILLWLERYYTRNCDPYDPLISPAYGDFTALPPLMLIASAAELLRDDSRLVAEHAREAGVPVRYDEWPGQLHDFPVLADVIPEGRQAIRHIGDFLRWVESEAGGSAGQAGWSG